MGREPGRPFELQGEVDDPRVAGPRRLAGEEGRREDGEERPERRDAGPHPGGPLAEQRADVVAAPREAADAEQDDRDPVQVRGEAPREPREERPHREQRHEAGREDEHRRDGAPREASHDQARPGGCREQDERRCQVADEEESHGPGGAPRYQRSPRPAATLIRFLGAQLGGPSPVVLRKPRMTKLLAIVPAYNEAGADRPRRRRAARARPGLRRRSSSTTARPTTPPSARARAGASVLQPPVQPRHRRRGAVRLPVRARARLRRRGAGRRRRPARPALHRASCCSTCARDPELDMVTGSRFLDRPTATATAPPRSRRIGIRIFSRDPVAHRRPAA